MTDYFIGIESENSVETSIKKSRFLSFSFLVNSEDEVRQKLLELKKNHPKATHICYAYKLLSGETRCSDDGEPKGSAGIPILETVAKRNLFNVLLVVVRYFGGIKLGAGGLLRAYLDSAKSCLEASGEKRYNLCFEVSIEVDISEVNKLEFLLKSEDVFGADITYRQNALLTFFVPVNDLSKLTALISGKLSRDVQLSVKGKRYI